MIEIDRPDASKEVRLMDHSMIYRLKSLYALIAELDALNVLLARMKLEDKRSLEVHKKTHYSPGDYDDLFKRIMEISKKMSDI